MENSADTTLTKWSKLAATVLSIILLPKMQNQILIMRKPQTNPNWAMLCCPVLLKNVKVLKVCTKKDRGTVPNRIQGQKKDISGTISTMSVIPTPKSSQCCVNDNFLVLTIILQYVKCNIWSDRWRYMGTLDYFCNFFLCLKLFLNE